MQASYQPTDLAAFTAELASTFRSAMEKAGLQFIVDCPALSEPVYVDREMWEKVVLNLLSNAFKYTFQGAIAVRLRAEDGWARVSIEDTGTGIPQNELPRLFERFHRVEGVRGRTQEGTGIGLALVAELIKLHGGKVEVTSTVGQGSTFTVTSPTRNETPRARRARSVPLRTTQKSYVEEAARWMPQRDARVEDFAGSPRCPWARVLVADDNADMRDYVARLLAGTTKWKQWPMARKLWPACWIIRPIWC